MTIITTTSTTPVDEHDWTGAIKTLSGIPFHVTSPDSEAVHLSDVAQALSLQCRYNGQIPSFYSVAEHSVYVSHQLREWGASSQLQLTGLLHDAAEAYVGDMVRPMKLIPELGDPFDEIEEKVADAVFAKLGKNAVYPMPDWVKFADKTIYEWEVRNIRTGQWAGKSPEIAKDMFVTLYNALTADG